jgi:hypothetical protein
MTDLEQQKFEQDVATRELPYFFTLERSEQLRALDHPMPGRVAVVGFDDTMLVRLQTPPVSSVSQPLAEMAEAAVSLKQGAGRLIRTETDRGLLVVCDTRVRQQRYGRRLLAALPPMGLLNSEGEALDWLAELAFAH